MSVLPESSFDLYMSCPKPAIFSAFSVHSTSLSLSLSLCSSPPPFLCLVLSWRTVMCVMAVGQTVACNLMTCASPRRIFPVGLAWNTNESTALLHAAVCHYGWSVSKQREVIELAWRHTYNKGRQLCLRCLETRALIIRATPVVIVSFCILLSWT